jgi:3-methyladenine DNA glycosylase AlkD
LRQIGKRNIQLHSKAIKFALEIKNIPSSTAKWIVADAIRELSNQKSIKRLRKLKI